MGKADKIPSQDGNPPTGLAGRLSPHPPDQGERRPGVPVVPGIVRSQPRKGSLEAVLHVPRPRIPADHLFHGGVFFKMVNGSRDVIIVVEQVMLQGIVPIF